METNDNYKTLREVEKRVKMIKNFYNHLQVFVFVMILLTIFSNTIIDFFEARISNVDALYWVKSNIWVNAILWLFGLIIHGVYAFKYKANFIDQWEKKKMDELMKQNK
jgi:hypothetical protein